MNHIDKLAQSTSKQLLSKSHTIITGFNKLIDQKIIKVDGSILYIYPELMGDSEKKKLAFIKNAYLYFRLKLNKPEGYTVYIKNIDTDQELAMFRDNQPIIL